MSVEENKALIRRSYEEGVNQGNFDLVDGLFAQDYVNHNSSLPEPIRGREAFKQYLQAGAAIFPDLHTTIEDLIGEDDRVVVRHTWRGTHKATGKQVIFTGVDIYRIADGKIAEEWVESDTLGMIRQLGISSMEHMV